MYSKRKAYELVLKGNQDFVHWEHITEKNRIT